MRSQLHLRPFRVLMVDTFGPIMPAVDGFKFVLHASCPFSGYAWFEAVKKNDSRTWAKFLVEQVYFDVCGFPAVLRSDQGGEFIGAITKATNELLGVEQVFGAGHHPQSQGHVEGGHNRLNHVLAAFTAGRPLTWPFVFNEKRCE